MQQNKKMNEKAKIEKKLEKFSKEFDKLLAKYEDSIVVYGDINGDIAAHYINDVRIKKYLTSFPTKKV